MMPFWVDATPSVSAGDAGNLVRLFRWRPLVVSGDLVGTARRYRKSYRSRNHVPRSSIDPMTSKFLRFSLVTAVFFAISALAQNSSAATPAGLPASSPAPSASPTVSAPTVGSGTTGGT